MRRRPRAISLVTILATAVAAGCSSSSSGSEPDAGVRSGDASFEASAPADSGPAEASAADAPADAAPPPPSAGSTGAFGIVTVNGKQKMYLPSSTTSAAGNATIAAVDVGVAGNGVNGAAALVKSIDLGGSSGATATGGDSSMIVAASTATSDVWFIDPTTDTVVKHINLDATYGQSSFSSGGGYVTGIAADAATHTAILSVWNGFALVDLATQAITKVIQAPPSENFGYDSLHHFIYAPFYDCTSSAAGDGSAPAACTTAMAPEGGVMPAGLSVIDLSDGTVYTYEDPAASDPTRPLGSEPDSAGVDPVSQIVVVPAENDGYESFLDFSKATFDKAARTVTAPRAVLHTLQYEGVAVEPTTHLVFWEGEDSSEVAVASAPQASTGSQSYVAGTMPNLPGDAGAVFINLGDPHGIAVTASILNGKPVGFVVDSGRQWVARVDLASLAALEPPDASAVLTPAALQAAVTYLDANTNE